MIRVSEISSYLENRVPSSLAMDFDNVGLLLGFPDREVHRVLLALDATSDCIQEARDCGAELIVTHHPIIFHPMKHILNTDADGKRVISLLQNQISVISLHTNLDAADGGVNTVLGNLLGLSGLRPLDIGRMGELACEESLSRFLQKARTVLSVSGMKYLDAGRSVHRVAVCGGSGGDLVSLAFQSGCDTLLTGEIRHHQWLEGQELGINLIEADHYCTEVIVLPALKAILHEGFPGLELRISSRQKQPSCGF